MSTPINAQLTGTFTSDGTAFTLNVPSGYTEIELTNLTDLGSTEAASPIMKAWGTSSMSAGAGIYAAKTSGAATIALPTTVAANGFTFISDSGNQTPEAALTVTSATNAAPPVLSMASSTGNVAQGDIVRYYGAAGQLNIAGMDFTAGTVVANTSIALAYMGAPGAAGTGGSVRRIPYDARYYPRWRYITSITAASSAVITMSVTHGLTVGQKVRIIVPDAFGMTQMNNRLATITAINTTTNTITVDVNSTGFTAFAFPSSATAAAGVTFALVVPVGEAATLPYANLLDDATDNRSVLGVRIGTAVQTTGKVYQWVARKGQSI
ncbi:hypothetical protein HC928_02770 [bacterium]|nr:hypothetical protein [bacterium]